MQVHREILSRCVEQIKTLAPILICSMKIFIQIISQVRYFIPSSVVNPWIRAADHWIRILLFSSLTFKTPTKS
jgi:hypothetical protein